MTRLRDEYDGAEEVLPDVTVAPEVTGTIHRPTGDAEPWCHSTADTEYVETETALDYGAELCLKCYRPVLEHLARAEETPVEHATDPPDISSPDAVDHGPPPAEEDTPPERVDALTAEVLVGTGGANTFHAPASDDVALCGEEVHGTRRRADQAPASSRPCRQCFTDAIVERYAPRDADLAAVTEAVTDGGER